MSVAAAVALTNVDYGWVGVGFGAPRLGRTVGAAAHLSLPYRAVVDVSLHTAADDHRDPLGHVVEELAVLADAVHPGALHDLLRGDVRARGVGEHAGEAVLPARHCSSARSASVA